MFFNGIVYLSVVGALCATDLVRHHYTGFRLYSDKGRPEVYEILPPPTCSLMRNVLFQPHQSGIGYTSVLMGDGIPYSMANCKMQGPHWLYWAIDWLPVWLPPKASRMSSRMQAPTILLPMSSLKSRPQSHCDCLNIMNSPKRTKNICCSFWTPF